MYRGEASNTYACIQVIDNGVGMDDETKERAIGVASVVVPVGAQQCGLVDQAGGTLNLSSEVGVGTTITLMIPMISESDSNPKSDS